MRARAMGLALKIVNDLFLGRLVVFLGPYFQILAGAAWTLEQGLDGYGVRGSAFVPQTAGIPQPLFSSTMSGHAFFLGILLILSIALWAILVVTGYVLARKTGVLAIFAISAIPGMLDMASLWPGIAFAPDTYVEGGHGVMGSGWGMGVLVVMGTLGGWCLMLILVDLIRLGEKCWHIYDHVWVIAGLLAAVFFVADTQVNFHKQELNEDSHTTQAASAYLAKQAVRYVQWCEENDETNTVSCRWASLVQQRLLDYSTEYTETYQEFGPRTSADIYAWPGTHVSPEKIEAIRTEIASYNERICPIIRLNDTFSRAAPPSPRCLVTPVQYGSAFPDPFHGKINKSGFGNPAALDIEGIVPTLVQLGDRQRKMQAKVDADEHLRYARWLYYLFFSIVVGGKIAGSTVKLGRLDKREIVESRRSFYFIRRVSFILLRCVRIQLWTVKWIVLRGWRLLGRNSSRE